MRIDKKSMGQAHRGPGWRHRAAGGARAIMVLWLACHILYTPIHLSLVSHSDETHPIESAATAAGAACLDHDGSHHEGDHDGHPASQHIFEAVNPSRLVVAATWAIPAETWAPWLEAVAGFAELPDPPECRGQGLSPPELARGWQFHFRAAPPVRAPSEHS